MSGPRGCDWLRCQTWCAHALRQTASALAKMAAKSFTARFRGSRRILSSFVAGAVVGAAGAGLTAVQLLRSQGAEAALAVTEPAGKWGPGSLPRSRCRGWTAPGVNAAPPPRRSPFPRPGVVGLRSLQTRPPLPTSRRCPGMFMLPAPEFLSRTAGFPARVPPGERGPCTVVPRIVPRVHRAGPAHSRPSVSVGEGMDEGL